MTRRLVLLLVAVLPVPALAAAPQLLSAGPAEAPLRLRLDGDGASVERPGGGPPTRLVMEAGAGIDSLFATRSGWVAVGTTPVPGGRDLALWTGGEMEAVVPMTPPPDRRGAVRAVPVPLLRDGELAGLAWLEGEAADRFGVWASEWDGTRWSAPAVVAPPGPGSQLALTGAVLADGTWALAWSAYDGTDDEVVWSRRRGGKWTDPRALGPPNEVPDVTPALRADGDGALLAWSRYDGNDYRLLVARLAGDRWSSPRAMAGAGTVLPRWQGDDLVFRDALHGAWVAASLDAEDRLRVEAVTAAPAEPRPVLARRHGELRLVFP